MFASPRWGHSPRKPYGYPAGRTDDIDERHPEPPQRLPFERQPINDKEHEGGENSHGYLHVYRTKKTLTRLLYIDGQSAAKSSLGTLDTQDIILLSTSSSSTDPHSDLFRGISLCALGSSEGWDLDGFIRMEAGFELILCNFTSGVEALSINRTPELDGRSEENRQMKRFEYMRALEKRYGGIAAGRVKVDYSSMVSAFFYPINLTNPSPDPVQASLPRISRHNKPVLRQIKSDLKGVLARERGNGIDWQGVVDLIVTRYSDRLKFLVLKEIEEKES